MIVPAKRIPIHPSRIHTLQPDEEFDIPSGLGGSFTLRFDGYRCERTHADFTIVSSSPPPDGWRGEKRSYRVDELAGKLFGCCPENPWFDSGKQEIACLRHLGYADESPEMTRLLTRCNYLSGPPAKGTPDDPIRYESLDPAAPDYRQRFTQQLDQAEKDAHSGKCICLSDLIGNSGM